LQSPLDQKQKCLIICNLLTNGGKGSFEIVGSDDTILVRINNAKGLLELLDLLLAEEREDVGSGLLGLFSFGRLKSNTTTIRK
jgi:hypothetical protein